MRFREILLLVVLIVAGLVLYNVQTGRWDMRWFDWDGDFIGLGREYRYEETRVFEPPVPSVLEIDNGHGWVEIRGGEQDHIELTFKKIIRRRSEEDARDIAGRLQYTVESAEDRLSLGTNREDFRRRNFQTGFILTVPRGTRVDIVNAHGRVHVESVADLKVRNRHGMLFISDIRGPCTLETSYQSVEVQRIEGECRITNKHGRVRAASVSGDLSIETTYARARVEDIGGQAEVRGRHMEVEARRIQGPVSVDTTYGKVFLEDVGPAVVRARHTSVATESVRGDLDVQTSYQRIRAKDVQGNFIAVSNNSSVTGAGIGGDSVLVRTSHGNVELTDFSAEVSVVLRNGQVALKPFDLKHGMEVRNQHGKILLDWPAGEAARLEARTRGGSIDWGLSETPDAVRSNSTSVIKAFQDRADKPALYLETTYADIRIKETGKRF